MVDRDDDPAGDAASEFLAAIGPVRRLRAAPPPPATPKPKPRARMAEADEIAARDAFRLALDEDALGAGDALSHRTDAVPPRAWQRLKRGEIAVQDELDLHGATVREAEAALRAFLHAARDHELGCVRVIHGKGRRADLVDDSGAPVLKNLVDRLLRHRADVLAFHSAPAAQGGTGAVLVLLARKRR